MLAGFIFITIGFAISSLLIYAKHRSKAELYYYLLFFNSILFLTSLIALLFYPEIAPITIFYIAVIIALFFGVGGKRPIQNWKELRKEYQRYIFGDVAPNVTDLGDFFMVNKRVFHYVRENSPRVFLAVLITILLMVLWLLIKRYYF